jgi:type I restriction enzyme, S subunit
MSFSVCALADLAQDERWDAEFYDGKYQNVRDVLLKHDAVPLGTFVESAGRGVGPSYDPSGTVRVINSVNVRQLELSATRQSLVSSSHLAENPNARVEKGNIVITSTGIGTMGRAFCNLTSETFFADGHITVVRLIDQNLAPYLCAFLQSPIGRIQFVQRRRGSSRQVEIYPEDILSILIPPMSTQKQAITSEWLSCVDDFNKALMLYPLAESELSSAIGWAPTPKAQSKNNFTSRLSRLQNHNRFDAEYYDPKYSQLEAALLDSCVSFEELVAKYVKGVQPQQYSADGSTIVVKSKDVLRGGINLQGCDRAREADLDDGQGTVTDGMLAMNMTGVGTLGRVSIVPKSESRTVISVDVSGWQLKDEILSPDYVSLFLNSPAGMAQSLRMQIGSSGQLHLYPEHVRKLLIYVRRNRGGSIDKRWHEQLATKVTQSASARTTAIQRLQRIFDQFAAGLGLNPIIYRE